MDDQIRLALPKGRMYEGVMRLLEEGGVHVRASQRDYRPQISLDGWGVKVLKPRAVVEMLAAGRRDIGFCGADWACECDADLVEVLDTGLDPVRLVVAAPSGLARGGSLENDRILLASEYERIARRWIAEHAPRASFIRSYGATEVLPPEDCDAILDNTQSGATLRANGLLIIDEVMASSTRLYASRAAMDDARRRDRIESLVMVLRAVLEARRRVMLELNAPADRLEAIIAILPCMREATVAPLHQGRGYGVKAAVPRRDLATLIPRLKRAGGSDIVVVKPEQIVV